MRKRLVAVIATATALLCSPAAAHVVSDRELQVFARFPSRFVERAMKDATPDDGGCVAPNRAGAWRDVVFQRPATLLLIDAAARGDSTSAERAWKALDQGFAAQIPSGDFRRRGAPRDSLLRDAAWVAAVCRGWIAVMNGPFQDRFRWRYALMKPKLERTVDFLEARSSSLIASCAGRPAALLVVAAAFLLADGTYHDERYGRVGQEALSGALARARSSDSCSFAADPSEHALGLEALQSIAIYFPSPTLERTAAVAARWLKPRSQPRPRRASRDGERWDHASTGEIELILRYATIPPPPPLAPPAEH
jgi:hypothetical protein